MEKLFLAMVNSKESVEKFLKESLEMLCCPVCKIKIHIKADGSGFRCEKCHRIYPIIDQIPMLRVDDAIIEKFDDVIQIDNVC